MQQTLLALGRILVLAAIGYLIGKWIVRIVMVLVSFGVGGEIFCVLVNVEKSMMTDYWGFFFALFSTSGGGIVRILHADGSACLLIGLLIRMVAWYTEIQRRRGVVVFPHYPSN